MKKIIVIMLFAVSALMAKGECAYSDRSSLELVLDYVEPEYAIFVCRDIDGTLYEVAFNNTLTYIVVGAVSKSGGYDVLQIFSDYVITHSYDDLGVMVKHELKKSSPDALMYNYRSLRKFFNFPTKHNNRR